MHMAGEHGDGGQAASFSRGRIYPGGMYETALAMIKEDAEERELTEWLFQRETAECIRSRYGECAGGFRTRYKKWLHFR